MVVSFSDEIISQVKELIQKEKKAKINWILTITQLSLKELSIIAEELGYVIKGEYIALASEADKLPEGEIEKWKPIDISSYKKINLDQFKYCPTCGNPLEGIKESNDISGHCKNCGEDLIKIIKINKKKDYFLKRCSNCGNINSVKAKYCIHCSSRNLTRIIVNEGATKTKFQKPVSPLKVLYFIDFAVAFLLAVGGIVWGIIEMATNIDTISTTIAIILVVIGGLLLFWPAYRIYQITTYLRYKMYLGEDLEEIL